MTDLGKVGINPRKAWVSETVYERLDLVSYKGAAYLALRETTAEPVDDNVNWMLIAEGVDTSGVEDIVDAKIATLSDVAISGAYGDLTGVPSALPADGGNADTVGGFHASQDSIAGMAVVRGSDKSIKTGAIISDTPNDEDPAVGQVIVTNGMDDQFRKVSKDSFKQSIQISNMFVDSIYNEGIYEFSAGRYVCFARFPADHSGTVVLTVYLRGGSVTRVRIVLDGGDTPVAFNRTPILPAVVTGSFYAESNMYMARTGSEWRLYAPYSPYNIISISGISQIKPLRTQILVYSLPAGYIAPTEVAYIP